MKWRAWMLGLWAVAGCSDEMPDLVLSHVDDQIGELAPTCENESGEDEYLAGDWDGDGRVNLAVRRGNCVLMDSNFDGAQDAEQCFGASGDVYLVGDWDGDGRDNLAVRRNNCVLMDTDFAGGHDVEQCFGDGASEAQYLVGDWNGDGRDNLAVRRNHCVLMDTDFAGGHDLEHCFGNGPTEDQYLAGDWDGDGRDNIAVRRNNCVLMDVNFDGVQDIEHCFGNGPTEDQYLAGDWDGDGRDNIAVRRNNCVLMDTSFEGGPELEQCYGNGKGQDGSCQGPVASLSGKRFTVYYQLSMDAVQIYADATKGLPKTPGHVHVFAHSGASQAVTASLADSIHAARDDFKYAPAFDLHEHVGWYSAGDAKLKEWAHTFRDAAIAAGADFFSFNEAPSATGIDAQIRGQMAKLLTYLAEPNQSGLSLRGIFFMTHKPSMPENWTAHAPEFWKTVNDTCDAVVAEHYHGHSYICGQSIAALGSHLFAMREWLARSGNPAKEAIASTKFTVLHSSRYAPGPSGWQGGDSNTTSLAAFQRSLSRAALATRRTEGGYNRISFAPIYDAQTVPGVHERIRLLMRWHYGGGGDSETKCVGDFPGNCACE